MLTVNPTRWQRSYQDEPGIARARTAPLFLDVLSVANLEDDHDHPIVEKKHFRETALPTGKIERETTQGRADVGDVPIAETLGTLARKVL